MSKVKIPRKIKNMKPLIELIENFCNIILNKYPNKNLKVFYDGNVNPGGTPRIVISFQKTKSSFSLFKRNFTKSEINGGFNEEEFESYLGLNLIQISIPQKDTIKNKFIYNTNDPYLSVWVNLESPKIKEYLIPMISQIESLTNEFSRKYNFKDFKLNIIN